MVFFAQRGREVKTTTSTPKKEVSSLLDREQVLKTINMDQVLQTIKVFQVEIKRGTVLSKVKFVVGIITLLLSVFIGRTTHINLQMNYHKQRLDITLIPKH